MFADRGIRFGRYRFHPTQGLTRGRQEVRVTPKSLAVLSTLVERAGEVVTREELFRAVWPDTAVSDSALTTCIQELRRAFADDARHPKFIETVHRRGFRFLAASSPEDGVPFERTSRSPSSQTPGPIVGRESALTRMSRALARAHDGQRQLVFITGELGIGKTALVDLFLAGIEPGGVCSVVRADCVEHHGAGEAYRPLLEAITRLCAGRDGEPHLAALRQCAPTWLAQLPALQRPSERRRLHQRTAGATPERMLRELTDALETMTTGSSSPIVLCLEDLHWSDVATLDWLASFARRREPARVLLIGTYRPGEAVGGPRTLESQMHELAVKGLCEEIALPRLDANEVREYVSARFPPADDATSSIDGLAALLFRRTEGNPLFVVSVLNDLTAQSVLVPRHHRWGASAGLDASSLEIPVDVRRTIERQIDRLDDCQRELLEAASIIGPVCSAAAVAAGTGVSVTEIESTFKALARRRAFVSDGPATEWPDGTLSATFEFRHSLYREVLSTRSAPGRRVELHRAVGARLEAAYGERAPELAAELAYHFEHGREFHRAVEYLQHAAETARRRSAHGVAREHYQRALAMLVKLPRNDARDAREIDLRTGLGSVVMQTQGWGAGDVEAEYQRVRELSETRGPGRPLLSALWNLWIFSMARAELDEARLIADRLFTLAEGTGEPDSLLQAHHAKWSTLFAFGDFHGTLIHTHEGLRLSEAEREATLAYGGHDAGVCARLFHARVLALSGRPAAAARMCDDAVRRARAIDHPFTLAFALMHVAAVHETRRDASGSRAHAAEARRVATEHGLDLMLAWATGFLGWSMANLGDARTGLTLLTEAVTSARVTGALLFKPHMLRLLASVQAANGLVTEALQTVADALAIGERTGERFDRAEQLRLRGVLRLEADDSSDSRRLAETDVETALGLAADQGAHQLGLRAAVSLARLWKRAGRAAEATRMLLEARGRVHEGEDLPDIKEADALIADDLSLTISTASRERTGQSPT